jgi:hypothetical protein
MITLQKDTVLNTDEIQGGLSEQVIPAVQGKFYAYSSVFTEGRPLYALMDCKANKSRPIKVAAELGSEVNLLFLPNNGNNTKVCSVKSALTSGIFDSSVSAGLFGQTWIACAEITHQAFYELRSQKNGIKLVELCQTLCSKHEEIIQLNQGTVVALMTDGGKHGLFIVKKLSASSIEIDACHILL